jgi:hypothetical protein
MIINLNESVLYTYFRRLKNEKAFLFLTSHFLCFIVNDNDEERDYLKNRWMNSIGSKKKN